MICDFWVACPGAHVEFPARDGAPGKRPSCEYLEATLTPFSSLAGVSDLGAGCFLFAGSLAPDREGPECRHLRIGARRRLGAHAVLVVIPDSIVKAHATRGHDVGRHLSNVINVILTTIFTFWFHWGIFGIALSTVLGRFGGLIYRCAKPPATRRRARPSGAPEVPDRSAPYCSVRARRAVRPVVGLDGRETASSIGSSRCWSIGRSPRRLRDLLPLLPIHRDARARGLGGDASLRARRIASVTTPGAPRAEGSARRARALRCGLGARAVLPRAALAPTSPTHR